MLQKITHLAEAEKEVLRRSKMLSDFVGSREDAETLLDEFPDLYFFSRQGQEIDYLFIEHIFPTEFFHCARYSDDMIVVRPYFPRTFGKKTLAIFSGGAEYLIATSPGAMSVRMEDIQKWSSSLLNVGFSTDVLARLHFAVENLGYFPMQSFRWLDCSR